MKFKEESEAKIKKLTNENMQIKEESEEKIKKLTNENTRLKDEIEKNIKKIVNDKAQIKEVNENTKSQPHKKESKIKLRKLFGKKAQSQKDDKPNLIPELKKVPTVHNKISIMPDEFDVQDIKLLILGSGDSGKTILIRQLKNLFIGFSDEERNDMIQVIELNLISDIKYLVESLQSSGRDVAIDLESYVDDINNLNLDEKSLTPEVADKIFAVWNDFEIRKVYEQDNFIRVSENAAFFLDNVKRIAQDNYIPTNKDMMKVHIRTSGISFLHFKVDNRIKVELVDVCGNKSKRELYQRCFQGVDILIFVVFLTDFDQFMFEDDQMRRTMDSIYLFKVSANSPVFEQKPIFLILNNVDIFEKKLNEIPEIFKEAYPDFTGNINDVNECIEHVNNSFFRVLPPDRNKEVAWTDAITVSAFDEKSVRDMFQAIARKIVVHFSHQ